MLKSGISKLYQFYRIKKSPIDYARSIGVVVGERCRLIDLKVGTFGSEPYLVRIGNHVTITSGVKFITHDGGVWVFREDNPSIDVIAPIIIGDNVFVGLNAIIMPGVRIGSNSVIGAGAIVTKDIGEGVVAVGCPARAIKSTGQYWESISQRSMHLKGLDKSTKRNILIKKFGEQLK